MYDIESRIKIILKNYINIIFICIFIITMTTLAISATPPPQDLRTGPKSIQNLY